jgi:Holliday junction resolvasome RuvABC endonuclease subunit
MNMKLKNTPKILGLDVSTKTTGFAIIDITGTELLELTHFSPKIKPQPEDKIEELLKKSDAFKKHLKNYNNVGIVKIVIEEPLLNSNNRYTVGTLLRYNSMLLKDCYDVLGIVPTFISTYDARKFAHPQLMGPNKQGKQVLFGGMPKDIDKKQIIWEQVDKLFPDVEWLYTRNNTLKKENYDMADAVTAALGHINKTKLS